MSKIYAEDGAKIVNCEDCPNWIRWDVFFQRLDMVRHFWLVKDYIKDKELFNWIETLGKGQNPFESEKFLKQIVHNAMEIIGRMEKNRFIDIEGVPKELVDRLWEEEYRNFNKSKDITKDKCDQCSHEFYPIDLRQYNIYKKGKFDDCLVLCASCKKELSTNPDLRFDECGEEEKKESE